MPQRTVGDPPEQARSRKPSALDVSYMTMTVLCGAAAWLSVAGAAGAPRGARLTVYAITVASVGGLSVAETLTRRPRTYLALLASHAACCLVSVSLAGSFKIVGVCLGLPITLGICLHNPFPLSILFSGAANGLIMAAYGLTLRGAASPAVLAAALVEYGVTAALLMSLAALAVSYRERFIDSREEGRRLDGLVDRLTRANLNYQEYAKMVEEASIDGERKRITRDIHDVVGYTLTNNITMMEAITDIMRTNPLGVASLVDAARENAEEGLARVREALHTLRGAEVRFPRGLAAVQRLVQVFQHATGVKVEFGFSEIPWEFRDEVDSAFYHVVQEGLMNSFRHGKATLVRIFLTRDADRIVLSIRDNGIGAGGLVEGIGLSGMRERLARAGGSLQTVQTQGGFELTASVPAERFPHHG